MHKLDKAPTEANISAVDMYILKHNTAKRERLAKVRATAFTRFPDAQERIYYGIPTVECGGKIVLQYAAYKNHVSLLVGNVLPAILKEKYPHYSYTEYTVVFLDKEPFPKDFLKEICDMLG